MTIAFWSNVSGFSQQFDSFTNVYNGSYFVTTEIFTHYNTIYYWYVIATDTTSHTSNVYKFTTTSNYSSTGCVNAYSKTESDNLFLGAILTVDNFQFCLIIMLGLWIFMISKINDDSIFGVLQIFIGLPLSALVGGYAYLNSLTYGYMITSCITVISLLVLFFAYWKKPNK
jgi:hypothetical protein